MKYENIKTGKVYLLKKINNHTIGTFYILNEHGNKIPNLNKQGNNTYNVKGDIIHKKGVFRLINMKKLG